MFRGASDSTSKCILHLLKALLKAFNLCERKSMVKKVAIVKTREDKGSGDNNDSGKVKNVTDATQVTNVVMAVARKGENLFQKR